MTQDRAAPGVYDPSETVPYFQYCRKGVRRRWNREGLKKGKRGQNGEGLNWGKKGGIKGGREQKIIEG